MNPVALAIPTLTDLRNITLARRVTSGNSAVVGGVPWDWTNYFGPSSVENISTAQCETFWLLFGGLPGQSFAQTSPGVVKSSSDQSFYTAQGYPAPPIGAVVRGINPDGTLGTGNYIESTPIGWYLNVLAWLGDVATATKLYQFAQWITVDASFYGAPIKLVRGVANVVGGAWVPSGDTILLRNQALTAWGMYRLYQASGDVQHRNFARQLMGPIALAINNIDSRIAGGELPSFMEGALYHAYYYTGTTDGVGPRYAFTWNRWTIEHLLGVAYMLYAARQVEGGTASFTDPQGTPYTIDGLLTKVGRWVDQFFARSWIMRRHNPYAPYMPYQFVYQQAWYNTPNYYKGVNFDWTEESGTRFGDTWWVGDLELWGIIGMLRLKAMGFVTAPVERFLYDWLRLPGPAPYTWYDRYQFNGEPLEHDQSSPIVFSALYGLALLEGYQPVEPPPRHSVAASGTGVTITPEAGGRSVVRDHTGKVLGVYTGQFTVPWPTYGVLIVEDI